MPSTTILVVVTDLLFESRLVEQGRALGNAVVSASTTHDARDALASGPALAIVDLNAQAIDWRNVVEEARERDVPILAFGRHTDSDLLRAAREAGCEHVVPRSTLATELPRLFEELAGGTG